VPKRNAEILLLQMIPKNGCNFASAGSRKIKKGRDLASVGDQVPKTNVTLLLQGVNISTNLNNCDFASTGS